MLIQITKYKYNNSGIFVKMYSITNFNESLNLTILNVKKTNNLIAST